MFYNVNVQKNITLNEFQVDHKTRSLWLAQANSYKYVDHRSYANVMQGGKAVVQTSSTTAHKTSTCNKNKSLQSHKSQSVKANDYCSNEGSRYVQK